MRLKSRFGSGESGRLPDTPNGPGKAQTMLPKCIGCDGLSGRPDYHDGRWPAERGQADGATHE